MPRSAECRALAARTFFSSVFLFPVRLFLTCGLGAAAFDANAPFAEPGAPLPPWDAAPALDNPGFGKPEGRWFNATIARHSQVGNNGDSSSHGTGFIPPELISLAGAPLVFVPPPAGAAGFPNEEFSAGAPPRNTKGTSTSTRVSPGRVAGAPPAFASSPVPVTEAAARPGLDPVTPPGAAGGAAQPQPAGACAEESLIRPSRNTTSSCGFSWYTPSPESSETMMDDEFPGRVRKHVLPRMSALRAK